MRSSCVIGPLSARLARLSDHHSVALGEGGLAEADGVVANWMERHDCAAALVRPDHYVFGVAADATQLEALMREWIDRLT